MDRPSRENGLALEEKWASPTRKTGRPNFESIKMRKIPSIRFGKNLKDLFLKPFCDF